MDRSVVRSRVPGAPLSPSHSARSLVRATLWLAATGFGLGAARAVFMGLLAAVRNLRRGKDCVQHCALAHAAAVPLAGAGKCHGAAQCPSRFYGNTHSHPFLQHARTLDRPTDRRRIPSPTAPLAP